MMYADNDEIHELETSHKGEKRNRYTMQFNPVPSGGSWKRLVYFLRKLLVERRF